MRQRLQNIYSKPLVKMKLNKLLEARKIVSIHAWKGTVVKLKSNQCQITYDILLLRSYDDHFLICQAYQITTSIHNIYVLSLLSSTIEHLLIEGKWIVFGKIIPNLFKNHKYILISATYLTVTDYEAIHSSQCNVIIRFRVPNSLVLLITYSYLTNF